MRKILIVIGLIFGLAAPLQAIYAQELTAEQQAELAVLEAALNAAPTPEAKQQVLTTAITNNPTLASDPIIASNVQTIAVRSGMNVVAINSAVVAGISSSLAPPLPTPTANTGSTGDAEAVVSLVVALIETGIFSGEDVSELVDTAIDITTSVSGDADTALDVAEDIVEAAANSATIDTDTLEGVAGTAIASVATTPGVDSEDISDFVQDTTATVVTEGGDADDVADAADDAGGNEISDDLIEVVVDAIDAGSTGSPASTTQTASLL